MTKTEWGEKRRIFFFIKERWMEMVWEDPFFTKVSKREFLGKGRGGREEDIPLLTKAEKERAW
jgi:hypothetical protein